MDIECPHLQCAMTGPPSAGFASADFLMNLRTGRVLLSKTLQLLSMIAYTAIA